MLENKFTSFEDKIQKQIQKKIKLLENKMETMEIRLQVIENKAKIRSKHPNKEMVILYKLFKMKDMIKALEEKVNNNLTLNNLEGKLDIKPIKEEMKQIDRIRP